MARRASSSAPPALIFGAVVVLVGVLIGGWLVYHTVSDPVSDAESAPLDVPAYLDEVRDSLRGNTYKVSATISNQLALVAHRGPALYAVEVESRGDILPILKFAAQFNGSSTFRRGTCASLIKIVVGDKGILKAQDPSERYERSN